VVLDPRIAMTPRLQGEKRQARRRRAIHRDLGLHAGRNVLNTPVDEDPSPALEINAHFCDGRGMNPENARNDSRSWAGYRSCTVKAMRSGYVDARRDRWTERPNSRWTWE
jgi:hypothetical protein